MFIHIFTPNHDEKEAYQSGSRNPCNMVEKYLGPGNFPAVPSIEAVFKVCNNNNNEFNARFVFR